MSNYEHTIITRQDTSASQIKQIKEAQESRDKGFLKLGYNLVLKQLP